MFPCEKNLERGLMLLGAPTEIRDLLQRGGVVVTPCMCCGNGHLLAIRQHGLRFEVTTVTRH